MTLLLLKIIVSTMKFILYTKMFTPFCSLAYLNSYKVTCFGFLSETFMFNTFI